MSGFGSTVAFGVAGYMTTARFSVSAGMTSAAPRSGGHSPLTPTSAESGVAVDAPRSVALLLLSLLPHDAATIRRTRVARRRGMSGNLALKTDPSNDMAHSAAH